MPVSRLHAQVARVALAAAAAYGFALGGGNALLAHGIISRPTRDVDLFTDQEHGVLAAAGTVEAALRDAGFDTERRHQSAGLADVFPGMGEGLAEWVVTAPDGAQMMLQMAYFDRGRDPVVMDIGAVLDLEDVAGGKVCALAGRVEPRDYADTAAMLDRFSPRQLLGFARRLDPGLEGRDFADAGQRLDQLPDQVFAAIGLGAEEIAVIRQRFTAWPRTAETADRAVEAAPPEAAQSGSTRLRADGDEARQSAITSFGADASREDPEAEL
jgi:Nucleotidyl transferase AbiEii toxin, Type IV TA system